MRLFLSSQSSQVESQLLTFQNVTIASSRLTWSRGDGSVKLTRTELGRNSSLDLGLTSTGSKLSLQLVALLGLFLSSLGLLSKSNTVVLLKVLFERSSVDLHNSRLGQCVGSHQFVVRWVVHHTRHSGLSGDSLGSPREVAGLDSQSSVLDISTSGSDGVDSFGADLGVGALSSQLKLSLLSELGSFSTGSSSLVTRIPGNTHVG
ncbi:hypothetical protein OGAPHI_001519 [Ogataea philodendri]|uniref:Uncharacterized protein n=1 Tax=Ogataea philodendri TaxID=1378263 RepID=A0A9P8PBU6_9ASCO|nr:uncharacterized protein OGAPHI_001519 [Ogataea philodendri]KAH3669398.1 hypothetical protein OGAPHI_001519 [Ogataea philodendri]